MATRRQSANQLRVAEDLFGYSPCMHCKHFHGGPKYHREPFVSCDAYPRGIPGEIFEGYNLHKKRHIGDKGIIFSPC